MAQKPIEQNHLSPVGFEPPTITLVILRATTTPSELCVLGPVSVFDVLQRNIVSFKTYHPLGRDLNQQPLHAEPNVVPLDHQVSSH